MDTMANTAEKAHPEAFSASELEQAYQVIENGGLTLVKLDIGYGFVGHSEESIKRMYTLKGRSWQNPCVVPGDLTILQELSGGSIDPVILDWLAEQMTWTTISVIADLDETSPLWLSLPEFVRKQSSFEQSVAVFLKAGAFLEALVERAYRDGKLLAGSSGNVSGKGNSYRPDELPDDLTKGVDLFIDHGVARYENEQRMATTMIDLRTLEVARRGVNFDELQKPLAELRTKIKGGKS
ncbi:Sua5/YciO/YrdC/YwlC family protein [Aestuariispira ectoiniformans]|uniref:Sua5/YciO/YrdC/YwlC family protein n=1 Tax=Aestuariispira ectoiniformans TaxID=2775080 RepID=UPI00223AC00B|nr:Sua5/YciO/YrdC/YwlC family protein [Aestuariispira ectoiniformans]